MFKDRKDAAEQLAIALKKYKDKDVIVLGIPRGGVETAYYIARYLNADFSLIICRKLGHPYNPEYALGAIAEDGTIYLNEDTKREVSRQIIDEAIELQRKEIQRRVEILRNGEPLLQLTNKTVIIADDGIATGATVFVAIAMCKKQRAKKIIVAAPVASPEIIRELTEQADEVAILEKPVPYYAVSQVYGSFFNLTDEETLHFKEMWEKEREKIKPA